MKYKKGKANRLVAMLLSFCMLIPTTGNLALAASVDNALCEHHTEHTAECGYMEGIEEQICGHQHDESCGYAEAQEDHPCLHTHDEACGYQEATEASPCAFVCEICSDHTGSAADDAPREEESDPLAETYGILYEFKTGTKGASLPRKANTPDMSDLPVDNGDYSVGDTVTAILPENLSFKGRKNDSSSSSPMGVWTFQGYKVAGNKVSVGDSNEVELKPEYLEKGKDINDPKDYLIFTGTWTWEETKPDPKPELITWYYEVLYQSYNINDDLPIQTDENGYKYIWKIWRFGHDADLGYWDQTVAINPDQYYGDNGVMGWDDVTGEQRERIGVHYIYDEDFPNEAPYQQRLSAKASEATKSNPLQVYYRTNRNDVIYKYEGAVPEGADSVLPETKQAPYKAPVKIADAPVLDGYVFSGWRVESPAYMEEKGLVKDGVFTMPNEDVTLVGSWTEAGETPSITIEAVDMGAYTGGDSMSGDSFPAPRYKVTAPDGVDLSQITFRYNGQTFQVENAGTPVVISALDEIFIYDEDSLKDDAIADGSAQNPVALRAENAAANDIEPGEYTITLENTGGITVEGGSADVLFKPGTLTVRYVSEPDRIVSSNDNFSTPALTEAPSAERPDGMASGVLSQETHIKTNGIADLGVSGIGEDQSAEIHLMFDNLLPAVEGGDGSVREQMLIDRAKELGHTLTDGQYQYKYLDLINAHDGNAWVTSSAGVDVYWPYPDGTSSGYTFQVLLYDDVNREYGIGTTDKLEEQINGSTVSVFPGTPTDAGVKFHLDEGDFGPCALVWTKNDTDPQPPTDGTGNLTVSKTVAGNAGDRQKDFHFTVTLDNKTINGGYGEMIFTEGVASFTLKHAESKTAAGLPEGTGYTVTEAEANQGGYTTDSANAAGKIQANSSITAAYTNTKNRSVDPGTPDEPKVPETPEDPRPTPPAELDDVPYTGGSTHLALWSALSGISLLGLTGTHLFFGKNRYRSDR